MNDLAKLVLIKVAGLGKGGVEKLSTKSGVSPSLIRMVMHDDYVPKFPITLEIVRACGVSETQALTFVADVTIKKIRKK